MQGSLQVSFTRSGCVSGLTAHARRMRASLHVRSVSDRVRPRRAAHAAATEKAHHTARYSMRAGQQLGLQAVRLLMTTLCEHCCRCSPQSLETAQPSCGCSPKQWERLRPFCQQGPTCGSRRLGHAVPWWTEQEPVAACNGMPARQKKLLSTSPLLRSYNART